MYLLTNSPLVFHDISTHQKVDPILKHIIIDRASGKVSIQLCLIKGVLRLNNHQKKPTRIYLLQSLVDLVITYYHDLVAGGHTLFMVKESFFANSNKRCHSLGTGLFDLCFQ